MRYQGTEVILDVKSKLPYQKRSKITSHLQKQEDVRDAGFNQFVIPKMIVSYDPKVIYAQGIRAHVKEKLETDGPATCLVSF